MIKLKDVTKYYSSDTSVTMALKKINLEFKKGEFIAITGKSGSGKSTLLNIISGMDTYEEGEMYYKGAETSYFDDRDWEDYRRYNISFIYQSYNLIDSYSALQNVETVMMICENDNSKKAAKERRKKALEILDRVGLKKWAKHKAVHLSSGQKQRLGIARALAKETDIIIADEPTGNLDIENGKAIMKILYELSKEKLVIVVTHNFEQVEEYASRKIRLFDGEIAEDMKLRESAYVSETEETGVQRENESKRGTFTQAIRFVKNNRKAQPHRAIFVYGLLFVAVTAFFIMYGYLLSNLDDAKTRTISDEIFSNTSDNRLVIRRTDGSVLSDEDIENLGNIRNVDYVDKFDYANEISCLYKKDKDYTIVYEKSEITDNKSMTITANDYSSFVSQAVALNEGDLIAGELPKEMYDVVVVSDDEKLIGTTADIYFKDKSWTNSTYLGGTFTITGILGSEFDKPYFSEGFVKSLNVNYGDKRIEINYNITATSRYEDNTREDEVLEKSKKGKVILVEGDGLTDNQIRLSTAITMNLEPEGTAIAGGTRQEVLNTEAVIKDSTDLKNEITYDVEIVDNTHNGSANVIEVSHGFLEQIYGSTDTVQVSVYMEDYAYTDRVINEIIKQGYEAISVYRVSAGDYENELVTKKITTLLISAGSIIVIFFLSILVIYAMMKLKRKDFIILKSLGMKQKTISQMNYYELITASILASVVLIIVSVVAKKIDINMISEMVKYYTVMNYLFIAALSVIMAIVTGFFFNGHLRKFLGGRK